MSNILNIEKEDLVRLDPPFQGNGITKNAIEDLGAPEYTVSIAKPLYINDGAAIYDIDRNGNETLRAIYYNGKWQKVD